MELPAIRGLTVAFIGLFKGALLMSYQSEFGEVIDALWDTIQKRKTADPEKSYTSYLLNAHEDKVLKKIGEESAEVVMASKDGDRDHLRYEVGDLLYHTLVNCARHDIAPQDIAEELRARFK